MLNEAEFLDPKSLDLDYPANGRAYAMHDALRRLDTIGAPLPEPILKALRYWDSRILFDHSDLAALATYAELRAMSVEQNRPLSAPEDTSTVRGRVAILADSLRRLERLGLELKFYAGESARDAGGDRDAGLRIRIDCYKMQELAEFMEGLDSETQ